MPLVQEEWHEAGISPTHRLEPSLAESSLDQLTPIWLTEAWERINYYFKPHELRGDLLYFITTLFLGRMTQHHRDVNSTKKKYAHLIQSQQNILRRVIVNQMRFCIIEIVDDTKMKRERNQRSESRVLKLLSCSGKRSVSMAPSKFGEIEKLN